METTFVNLKSELTGLKDRLESNGYKVYRTRLKCNCQKEFNHRYGLLVTTSLGDDEIIIIKAIRCKACAKGGATW
ncbi:MAG: hypothetical protein RBU23_12855 [Candidatus Auribacterota bacterium]|jgi:hypothetical protein|nr:hypothetical protein [Candidatus Auribacterota bacterium]